MQLQKVRAAFTTIIVALCLTMIPQTTQAQPDVSKIMTYEALLDTFNTYTDAQTRIDCLYRIDYLKDSLNITTSGHEQVVNTLLSLGLHDSKVTFNASMAIADLNLHYFEDTIFTLLKPNSNGYFRALSQIGGHRTSEYFKSIIQHYNFDKYEYQTISALVDMNDSAFYLIPEIKKYRDSIGSYYDKNCPRVPHEMTTCWDLDDYRSSAKGAVDHLEYMMELHHTDIITSPEKSISQPQVNSPAAIQKSGCIYTPDGRLLRGPLIKNGVYIKDGKLIVNMETVK